MIIKAIRIGRTINMGNYESLKVEMEGEVQEGDTVSGALAKLKSELDQYAEILKGGYKRGQS